MKAHDGDARYAATNGGPEEPVRPGQGDLQDPARLQPAPGKENTGKY